MEEESKPNEPKVKTGSKDEDCSPSGWFLDSTVFPEKRVHFLEAVVLSTILVLLGTLVLTVFLTTLFPGR